MRPPRTVLAVGLAGLCTAGLGGGVVAAHAEIRTFEVTMAGGEVFSVTLDLAPGTELRDIDFPDLDEAQIVAIQETATPAPAVTTTTPLLPPPKAIETDPPAGEPVPATGEPQVGDGARRQKTTGDEEADRRRKRHRKDGKDGDDGQTAPGHDGLPTIADPSLSVSVPTTPLMS